MNRLFANTKYFLGLTALFIVLIFALPANHITKASYQLTSSQYHVLLFLVELPIIASWYAAFYGYSRLALYARTIKDTPEGNDFTSMSKGMRWIAWGLPIPAIVTLLLNAIANSHHGFLSTALIIGNYLYVIVSVVAFSFISSGTRALAQRSKVYLDIRSTKALVLAFVTLGVVFCYVVFSKMHTINLGDSYNSYYLPNWLIVLTIIIPYLYAWFIGLLAAFELTKLAQQTSGIIYKQSLTFLSSGLVLVIVALSSLQYFRSIIPRTGHLAIGSTLLVTYLIYALNAAGCVLLAIGARRLKKIEDV